MQQGKCAGTPCLRRLKDALNRCCGLSGLTSETAPQSTRTRAEKQISSCPCLDSHREGVLKKKPVQAVQRAACRSANAFYSYASQRICVELAVMTYPVPRSAVNTAVSGESKRISLPINA
eukprot:5903312-Pleurochrysis_carterae.AAC.1